MRTIVAGNWKMHKDRVAAMDLINAVMNSPVLDGTAVEVMVAPPYPFLAMAVEQVRGSRVVVAAQNCHEAAQGAYTGEVSVDMLKSIGVTTAIVGHSERRQYFGETDATVNLKIKALLKAGCTPIYCCGEVQAQRESGEHFQVVAAQMKEGLMDLDPGSIARLVIAYEPVWAIGTGLTASPQQAQEMHAFIRQELRTRSGDVADTVPILYGGSCKPDNAAALFSEPDINGGLIGGAALQAESFTELVRIATTA